MWYVNPADPAAVDLVHGLWTYSTELFFRKIIQIIPKTPAPRILQKTP
jgi:hypothetical protein